MEIVADDPSSANDHFDTIWNAVRIVFPDMAPRAAGFQQLATHGLAAAPLPQYRLLIRCLADFLFGKKRTFNSRTTPICEVASA